MEQRISGWRIWLWGALAMVVLAFAVLIPVMKGQGFDQVHFSPQLLLFFIFFIGVGLTFFYFAHSKNEEEEDLP